MTKYKVFKDFHMPDGRIYEKWEIVTIHNDSLSLYLNFSWYIWEIPQPRPKYKVWDYIVSAYTSWTQIYEKIYSICEWNEWEWRYNNKNEDEIRTPTKDELDLYFR